MVISANRSHFGAGFFFSLLFHGALLLLFAISVTLSGAPSAPKASRLIVDFVEGMKKTTESEEAKEPEKLAAVSNSVKKETFKKKTPPVQKTPSPIKKTVEVAEKTAPPEKSAVEAVEQMAQPEPAPPKEEPLPTMSELIPSYEQMTKTMTLDTEMPDAEEGSSVSLNTSEFKYISYFSRLKNRIQEVWKYPEAARRAGLQGKLKIRFTVDAGGRLLAVKIVKSSGIPILDDEAIKAIRRAAPFDAMPRNLGEKLSIDTYFTYQLDYYRAR